jgi:methylmalonyl-CoA mutase N-terminal domain/subunit
MLRFHTQTAGCTLTAQQPENNIVRVALQALAAVLGGTQSLHTNSRDEAYALPTEEAVTIALRTQQLIAFESGIADTIDPLAGSYAVESLTSEIEKGALAYIEKIDAMGGAVAAVEAGYMQNEIAESAYRYQKEIESGARTVVGVNRFQVAEGPLMGTLRVSPEIEHYQKEKLAAVKRQRDERKVAESLAAVRTAARGKENIVAPIFDAVRRYATLGEMSDALRAVFGEYKGA